MKTTEIVGFRREEVGTKASKRLRADGNVPSVLYGGEETIHFHAPAILFRDVFYTPDSYIVNLNIEGVEKKAILQDAQFHPVSDKILHVDFYELNEGKEISMNIPVQIQGAAPGVLNSGGVLIVNKRKLRVRALPQNLPDEIVANISELELGNKLYTAQIAQEKFSFLHPDNTVVCQVKTSRASIKSEVTEEGAEEGTEEAAAE